MSSPTRRTVAIVLTLVALVTAVPEIYLLSDVPGEEGWDERRLAVLKAVSALLCVTALVIGRTARVVLALAAVASAVSAACWVWPYDPASFGYAIPAVLAAAVASVLLLVAALWITTVRVVGSQGRPSPRAGRR
jgi:hypothetical protein